jgi:hypothetical protein
MRFALLAVSSGATLYLASAAALSDASPRLGLLAVLLVALAHAACGFLAVGGWAAAVNKSPIGMAVCAIASATVTAATATIAAWAAIEFHIAMDPGVARIVLATCLAVSIAGLALAIQLARGRCLVPNNEPCGNRRPAIIKKSISNVNSGWQ